MGGLADPYTATLIAYVRGGASEVDIDHVVALSDAWQKGAQQWSYARSVKFANDPLNLLAVDASANRQKGDGDAATWLPANKSFRCTYVARQIAVKQRYQAWVTQAERDALRRVLTPCPGTPLPKGGRVRVARRSRVRRSPHRRRLPHRPRRRGQAGRCSPAAARCVPLAGRRCSREIRPTTPTRASTATRMAWRARQRPYQRSGPRSGGELFTSCDAVRAAGRAPLLRGDPAYAANPQLDRDKDGVACEL